MISKSSSQTLLLYGIPKDGGVRILGKSREYVWSQNSDRSTGEICHKYGYQRIEKSGPRRAEVVDDAMYLAHDFVNVAFKDESDAEVAYVAVKTAKDFINEELESKGVKVPIDEETENEMETKQTTEGNISPGDFLEQFPGVKKLERKGGPKEKPKEEKVDYVVNDGVINIYDRKVC